MVFAGGAADFNDRNIGPRPVGRAFNSPQNFFRNVRDGIHAFAVVTERPFFINHILINHPAGHIIFRRDAGAEKPFVITHILIAFQTGIQHKHLAVFNRIHRAGVHIQIGINFHQIQLEAAGRENFADGRNGHALTDAGHHSADNENVFMFFAHGRLNFQIFAGRPKTSHHTQDQAGAEQ